LTIKTVEFKADIQEAVKANFGSKPDELATCGKYRKSRDRLK